MHNQLILLIDPFLQPLNVCAFVRFVELVYPQILVLVHRQSHIPSRISYGGGHLLPNLQGGADGLENAVAILDVWAWGPHGDRRGERPLLVLSI